MPCHHVIVSCQVQGACLEPRPLPIILFPSSSSHHPLPIILFPSSTSHHPLRIILFPSSTSHHPLPIILFPSSSSHHPLPIIHFPSSSSHHPLPIIHFPNNTSLRFGSIIASPSLFRKLSGHRLSFFLLLYPRFYLDVKGRDLDTEKLFAYRAVSRSFLSM